MLALELNKSVVKAFMGQILREELFDGFDVRSIEIAAPMRISIDGGTDEGFSSWGALRPLVYMIIKECQKPKLVKIVLSLSPEKSAEVHFNAAALFLNMVYENDCVTFTTATAQKEFVLDKTLDAAWDEWISGFFVRKGLPVTARE